MAQQTIGYKIYDLLGERALVGGERIYDMISPHIRAGRHVTLDFEGVRLITPGFWDFAAAPLMEDLDPATVLARLTVVNLPAYAQGALEVKLEHAYRWQHDPKYRAWVEARRAEYAREMGYGDADPL